MGVRGNCFLRQTHSSGSLVCHAPHHCCTVANGKLSYLQFLLLCICVRLLCVVCGVCVCVCAAGEKNEVEFLQTTEGDQFQCIFSKVRYGSIVSDPQSVQTLDEDRIVPQSKPFDMGRRREGGGSLGPLEAVFLQLVRSCHSTSLCELG